MVRSDLPRQRNKVLVRKWITGSVSSTFDILMNDRGNNKADINRAVSIRHTTPKDTFCQGLKVKSVVQGIYNTLLSFRKLQVLEVH